MQIKQFILASLLILGAFSQVDPSILSIFWYPNTGNITSFYPFDGNILYSNGSAYVIWISSNDTIIEGSDFSNCYQTSSLEFFCLENGSDGFTSIKEVDIINSEVINQFAIASEVTYSSYYMDSIIIYTTEQTLLVFDTNKQDVTCTVPYIENVSSGVIYHEGFVYKYEENCYSSPCMYTNYSCEYSINIVTELQINSTIKNLSQIQSIFFSAESEATFLYFPAYYNSSFPDYDAVYQGLWYSSSSKNYLKSSNFNYSYLSVTQINKTSIIILTTTNQIIQFSIDFISKDLYQVGNIISLPGQVKIISMNPGSSNQTLYIGLQISTKMLSIFINTNSMTITSIISQLPDLSFSNGTNLYWLPNLTGYILVSNSTIYTHKYNLPAFSLYKPVDLKSAWLYRLNTTNFRCQITQFNLINFSIQDFQVQICPSVLNQTLENVAPYNSGYIVSFSNGSNITLESTVGTGVGGTVLPGGKTFINSAQSTLSLWNNETLYAYLYNLSNWALLSQSEYTFVNVFKINQTAFGSVSVLENSWNTVLVDSFNFFVFQRVNGALNLQNQYPNLNLVAWNYLNKSPNYVEFLVAHTSEVLTIIGENGEYVQYSGFIAWNITNSNSDLIVCDPQGLMVECSILEMQL